MLIPVIVTLALATFNPFVGIIIFIALFLAESFAKVYKAMDVKKRPSARHIVFMTFGASALMIIGLLLVQWFPENITISWQERRPWFCHCYGRIIQSQSLYGNVGLSHVRFRVYFRVDRYYCR